jgi:RimJ/RimL family protein N-acetyltransferase
MAFTRLETPRLIIRRFQDSDLNHLVAYRSNPEVERYQMWENYSEAKAQDLIDTVRQKEPGEPEAFQFALEAKASSQLIGDLMLRTEENDKRLGEIGYTLAPHAQGQGLATEAVQALIQYCFETLSMHRLSATADPRNDASLRLLERLGFRREAYFIKSLWFKGDWADDVVYALLRDEWLERQGLLSVT